MKMYFICYNQGPEWFLCYGILNNGFLFASHLCSHPNYARHDLYFQRPERIEALMELFQIDPKTIENETIVVNSKEDVPDWLESHDALQDDLQEKYDKYEELINSYKKR